MKVSEFLKVSVPNQLFCIKKVGEMVSNDEEIIDKDDVESGNFINAEVKEIDFILDIEKSCKYIVDIVVVLFIYTEVDKFCDEFLKS